MAAVIKDVQENSIAAEGGLQPGDILLAINGSTPRDLIDYQLAASDTHLILEIERPETAEHLVLEVEKDADEPLGIVFQDAVFDGVRTCANRCLFCFVEQQPSGMRPSLYIKDDDYRLSFLQGTFVTLTNLSREDWLRIERLRLSPLRISVHTTNPGIRRHLLGSPRAGLIGHYLRWLRSRGIQFHAQIVLCPGINDGPVLKQTIEDLAARWPAARSVSVVPVGLTKHRPAKDLRSLTADEASYTIDLVRQFQDEYLSALGTRFVWAADELYLRSGQELPPLDSYEDFPQFENGVGNVVSWLHDFQSNGALRRVCQPGAVVVTGYAGVRQWQAVVDQARHCGLTPPTILVVKNAFYGCEVSVSGLLTFADILRAVSKQVPQGPVFIPDTALAYDGRSFLDGYTIADLEEKLEVPVETIDLTSCPLS